MCGNLNEKAQLFKSVFKTYHANGPLVSDYSDTLEVVVHHQLDCMSNLIARSY